jgi:hypothetical protein
LATVAGELTTPYRASGLVLWHFTAIQDVRSHVDNRGQSGPGLGLDLASVLMAAVWMMAAFNGTLYAQSVCICCWQCGPMAVVIDEDLAGT